MASGEKSACMASPVGFSAILRTASLRFSLLDFFFLTMPDTLNMNLVKLVEQFGSDEKCRDYLEAVRWPDGPVCPRCHATSITTLEGREQFECNKEQCRYRFSVTVDTIFHGSHVPLWKWFITIYLMLESRKGVSANQIKRTVKVTYKTAWYLCHRVRDAMKDQDSAALGGTVEADETWVGGIQTNQEYWEHGSNKTVVAGVFQRDGKVRLKVIPNASKLVIQQFVEANIRPDTVAIYTDESSAYRGIGDKDTKHEAVNHSRMEWARGDVHTNGIENVWSLLKRSIVGAFHHVSSKHLDAYCDELEWRFNNRKNDHLFRDTLQQMVGADRLPYRTLVDKEDASKETYTWLKPEDLERAKGANPKKRKH